MGRAGAPRPRQSTSRQKHIGTHGPDHASARTLQKHEKFRHKVCPVDPVKYAEAFGATGLMIPLAD
jgi:hypothetical protein